MLSHYEMYQSHLHEYFCCEYFCPPFRQRFAKFSVVKFLQRTVYPLSEILVVATESGRGYQVNVCLRTTLEETNSMYSVGCVQCGRVYGVGCVECGVCTVWGVYSVGRVQCEVWTVWGVYSVGRVQCGVCTVWGVYSVGCVQCGACTAWSVYSVGHIQCGVCTSTHVVADLTGTVGLYMCKKKGTE